ncbi:MAG: hypothetical protein J6L76_00530 [Clostridia bacterium]|nr:hypothetical protein [Clostridia bacterium]
MKRYFRVILPWIFVLIYVLLPGCKAPAAPVSLTTAIVTPTYTPAPTPVPFTERCIEAFKSYESAAGVCTVYDVQEDLYLYTKQEVSTRIFPASTTKLFTIWVALQYLSPEEYATVGDELNLVAEDASVADLKKGYVLPVSTLIEGMLLPSGNDAAYVIACHAGRRIAGNSYLDAYTAVKTFMNEVNRQAELNGLSGTHFTTPDGYHHPEHYTTVEDLIKIAKLALNTPVIMQYTQIPEATIQFSDGEQTTWKNTNWLVCQDKPYYLKDAIGLKTGYTEKAGYIMLAAIRNPHTESVVIILVAQCPNIESRFAETISLYNVLKSVEFS